jgi:cytochrome c oxidase assembly protein subunit 15
MHPSARLLFFRRLALLGTMLALVVVVLGAWVRLSVAGLGCPDWPGCYGHLSVGQAAQHADSIAQSFPERPFQYAKAQKEMIHRYFAGALATLIVILAGLAIRNRNAVGQPLLLPLILVLVVVLQALLGMWTVTLLLKPLIVVLHLLGGLTTLAMLAWLAIGVERTTRPAVERGLRVWALLALLVLGVQIMLGGWTSSNYAAVACPDFPTCQNSYWPHMDMQDAFVLWRGLAMENENGDYEGGVLDHPARVAIHFVHRLGALVVAFFAGLVAWLAWRRAQTHSVRVAGALVAMMLVAQLILGPVMVVRGFPLLLATLHNAVAALLLLSLVRLNRLLWVTRRRL